MLDFELLVLFFKVVGLRLAKIMLCTLGDVILKQVFGRVDVQGGSGPGSSFP